MTPFQLIARLALGLAVLASLTAAPAHSQAQVPCSTGQQPMCYREYANCSISAQTETDVYQFFGAAGDKVRITLRVSSGCWDPKVELFNPDFGVHSTQACGGCACTVLHQVVLTQSGMHTLAISDNGQNNTGGYWLELDPIVPNDVTTPLSYGVSTNVSINFGGHHQWRRFDVTQGTTARIAASVVGGCLDPKLEVFDMTGQPVTSATCGGCSCSTNINFNPAPTDRTLYLLVSDSGNNNTGTIQVTLTCLLGVCVGASATPAVPGSATFCTTTQNTTGNVATITAFGSSVITDNDVLLRVTGAPANKFAIFFAGMTPNPLPAPLPFSQGTLCLLPPLTRLPLQFTCSGGMIQRKLDLTSAALAPIVAPGQTTYFQAWFRDPTASTTTFDTNTSDGLAIPFQ